MGLKHDPTQSVAARYTGTTLEGPAREVRRAPPVPLLLRVHGGTTDAIKSWPLDSNTTLLGRAAPHGGVMLSDQRSSRVHAGLRVVSMSARTVRLENHSKKNGSFLFGARVESADVPDGGVLRFGDSIFVLRWTDPLHLSAEAALPADSDVDGLRGVSDAMRAVRQQLRLVAPTTATVLLLGETGTGKEVSARALHAHSARSGRFVPVNCAALPEQLVESQLFGHRKGAFTGADHSRDGFFQDADGGTLFFDELGELPAAAQAKLLRVLDDKRVARLGETEARPVDVRIIAATNRDLGADVSRGAFRADLYARLAEITIELPPLRARREDVLVLARGMLEDRPIDADLAERLLIHGWPYNVRELTKVAAELRLRAADGDSYRLEMVERRLAPPGEPSRASPTPAPAPELVEAPTAGPPTREELRALLTAHDGNIVEVARVTGRSRKQVYRWLDKHALDPTTFRRS